MFYMLDKSRDFATIHPAIETPSGFLAFKQAGRYFDNDGKRVRTAEDAPDPKPQGKPRVAKAAPVESAAPEPELAEGDVNLSAWADRKAMYRFAQVRQAIQDRYHSIMKDEFEAREFLYAQGIGSKPDERASIFAEPIIEVPDEEQAPPPLV